MCKSEGAISGAGLNYDRQLRSAGYKVFMPIWKGAGKVEGGKVPICTVASCTDGEQSNVTWGSYFGVHDGLLEPLQACAQIQFWQMTGMSLCTR